MGSVPRHGRKYHFYGPQRTRREVYDTLSLPSLGVHLRLRPSRVRSSLPSVYTFLVFVCYTLPTSLGPFPCLLFRVTRSFPPVSHRRP